MTDPVPPGGPADALDAGTPNADVPNRDGVASLATARRALRDLAALLALPAMWLDQEPADIAESLLGVLRGVLGVASAYVRFDDPSGGPPLERWRPGGQRMPAELEPHLATPVRERGIVTISVATSTDDGVVRVTSMAPSLPGEDGLVLVGSRRADFPTDPELHLLRVAVGQAAISIHAARRLSVERVARAAAEAALRRRDVFLANLAQDLASPLSALAALEARAHAFATETDQPAARDARGAAGAVGTAGSVASPRSSASARLTRRQAEVLGLLAQGLSNREIAGVIWLSERTVERHVTGLYQKIGVDRRSEATAFALRHGLVDADAREG